jgi:hypothetical protein
METPSGLAPKEYFPGAGSTYQCTSSGIAPCGSQPPAASTVYYQNGHYFQATDSQPYWGCGALSQCWVTLKIADNYGNVTNVQPEFPQDGSGHWAATEVTVDPTCTQNGNVGPYITPWAQCSFYDGAYNTNGSEGSVNACGVALAENGTPLAWQPISGAAQSGGYTFYIDNPNDPVGGSIGSAAAVTFEAYFYWNCSSPWLVSNGSYHPGPQPAAGETWYASSVGFGFSWEPANNPGNSLCASGGNSACGAGVRDPNGVLAAYSNYIDGYYIWVSGDDYYPVPGYPDAFPQWPKVYLTFSPLCVGNLCL